jgi:ABC-type iron transport system FetAB ATPase subunit
VERYVLQTVKDSKSKLKTVVWITHSKEQGQRVGSRFFDVADGGVRELHEARQPDV